MNPRLLGGLLLLLASAAWAHRLDEYLQATRVAVSTNRIELSLNLTPGVALVDQVLAVIDKDRDGQISDVEVSAYAQLVLKDIRVGLDEKPLVLKVENSSFPALKEVKEGLGVIRIKASAAVHSLAAGRHTISLTNVHLPAISVYLVNALVPEDRRIKITQQTRDELQKNYRLEFMVSSTPP